MIWLLYDTGQAQGNPSTTHRNISNTVTLTSHKTNCLPSVHPLRTCVQTCHKQPTRFLEEDGGARLLREDGFGVGVECVASGRDTRDTYPARSAGERFAGTTAALG